MKLDSNLAPVNITRFTDDVGCGSIVTDTHQLYEQTLPWAGIGLSSLGLREKRLDLPSERCDYSRKSATGIYRNSIMVKSSSPCSSGVQSQPGFDQDLNFTVPMPIYCNELTTFFTLQNLVLSFLACRLQQRVG